MIYIYNKKNVNDNKLKNGYSSEFAEKMNEQEMRKLIENTR
jgi:hypothetical protein